MINIRSCYSCLNFFHKMGQHNVRFTHGPLIFYKSRRLLHREVNENVQNRLRIQDSVDKDYRIIYRAPLINYVKITYGITSVSSAIFLPFISANILMQGLGNYPVMFWNVELIHSTLELTGLYGCSLLAIGQIIYTVFKFPFRIYYSDSSGKYAAIYQHILPWKTDKEEFYAGEIKKCVKSYSLWHDVLYSVKNRKAILMEDYFFIPQDMNDMLSSEKKKK